jgi:spore coat polysaccharide biosynthesis protein SpsF
VKIGAIILSRMDSTRLPGKALLDVGGRPLLTYALSLCQKIDDLDSIAIATSTRLVDDPLSDFAKFHGIPCIRGSLDDVADRFLSAMEVLNLDAAVRINGDSPLNNKHLISDGIRLFRTDNFDLVSNVPARTYPYGMSVEVVGRKAMEYACSVISDAQHREHVTKYFYDNQDKFDISLMTSGVAEFSEVQLAIDTREDLDRFEWIIGNLEGDPADSDIASLVKLAKAYSLNAGEKE